MAFDFRIFSDPNLHETFIQWLTDLKGPQVVEQFSRLWNYYQNPVIARDKNHTRTTAPSNSGRGYIQSQEVGLPARITGIQYTGLGGVGTGRAVADVQRKEVVIENDIAWRINAMVDFLFGKGVRIISKASDPAKRDQIEKIINAVIEANGGTGFFQDMAVLGSVYGFVDCLIRPPAADELISNNTQSTIISSVPAGISQIALELIEAPRALPVLDEDDYRRIRYYVQDYTQQKNQAGSTGTFLGRLLGNFGSEVSGRKSVKVTEVIGPDHWQRYEDKQLVAQGPNIMHAVPVVHIQNLAQPYYYEGISDVGQLIGMQDELNTRLCDRANRITLQAFKMYLVKGIESSKDKPVSPGRMWFTNNLNATIEEFGGDEKAFSEDQHITEIREAMDKISGVTPVVAGLLGSKIGNLTSGVALKMTFMGMLSKTARKQLTYGAGIRQICAMVLRLLDNMDVYRTTETERQVEVIFPNPLPEDMSEKLKQAQVKRSLGIDSQTVLTELGYK